MPVLIFLIFAAKGISITSPKPIMPPGALIEGNAMTWKSPDLAFRIEPLDQEAFFAWLKSRGVDEKLLEQAWLRELLSGFAIFRFSFYNYGQERLVFNPEQVLLRNRNGIVGTQVKLTDFLFAQHGHSNPEIEKLAELFNQETFELASGHKIGKLIAFRPLDVKFPKKTTVFINNLYYGIVSLDASCEFQIRYTTP